MSEEYTSAGSHLSLELKSYPNQIQVPKPKGYVDQWYPIFVMYHPVIDEFVMIEGFYPGFQAREWFNNNPGKPFPIRPDTDRVFPAKWETVRDATVFNQRILEVLGLSEEKRVDMCDRLHSELWFPIAEHAKIKNILGGIRKLGGHTVPTHGHLLGFNASKTCNVERYGPARDIKVFRT